MSKQLYKGVVIFGPTASGKTALSIKLARLLDGEVVNADSRQLYKGMRILTAAPTVADMQNIPHHLFEMLDPKEKITASDYANLAKEKIADILSRGKVPIICGGTGFYLKVLFEGIAQMPDVDEILLQQLRDEHQKFGGEHMHASLPR